MADPTGTELTGSPQLNELIRTAQGYLEGHVDGHTLKDVLTATERFLLQMQAIFQQQARFREKTPLFLEEAPRILEHFRALGTGMAEIAGFFKTEDIYQMMRGLDRVKAAFAALVASLDALKAEEDAQPVYSRSPYLNLLMRLAAGVRRGTLAPDALRDALAEMLAHHRGFAAGVDRMARGGREAALYQEKRGEIQACLGEIEAGLAEAQRLLGRGELDPMTAALQHACDATERLTDIQDEFTRAEEAARLRPCFRCGTANVLQNRHCAKCGGMLPPMPIQEEDSASFDVRVDDTIRATGHVQTELTQRLGNAVHDVKMRRIDTAAFARELDAVATRVAQGRREFECLAVPGNLAEEEREAVEQTREAMRVGIQEMEEGLALLRTYVVDGNPAHLELGLEAALCGADKIQAVQAVAQAARGS